MDDQSQSDQQAAKLATPVANIDNRAVQMDQIRKQALDSLVPLLDEMNGSPERKFEILITAARMSDDPSILSKSLTVANQIEEPSARADALLDVINEASFQQEQ